MVLMPRFLLLLSLPLLLPADSLIPPLSDSQAAQARKILSSFKENPRGPFLRIRWFCNDGSIHPPAGTPCRELGGGHQHAELSADAKRLADWNVHAGTILTGLPFTSLLDADRDHHWLKELVLEKYLTEVDQGWIYRRAISYRGARQVEDEERAGRKFLLELFSDAQWLERNYYLGMQLMDTIPHGVADSTIKRVRSLAAAAANEDSRLQRIRAKIHSYPGPEDTAAVTGFLQTKNPSPPVKAYLEELATLLEKQYSPQNWIPALESSRKSAAGTAVEKPLADLAQSLQSPNQPQLLQHIASLSLAIRRHVSTSKDGRLNLALMDLNRLLQEMSFHAATPSPDASRAQLLENLRSCLRVTTGSGLISLRQFRALEEELDTLKRRGSVESSAYRASIRYLARASEWSRATAAKDFGPVSRHYQAVEPLAAGLVDHLLRSSAALPLSNRLDPLLQDAERAAGIRHSILGRATTAGAAGLNPGVGIGKLGIIEEDKPGGKIDPGGIYLIPQTVAELKPMAGILTLEAGNMLSHAQLLAANLGVPNARIPSSLLPELEKRKGMEMFYAVTPRNIVVLKEKASMTEEERKLWTSQPTAPRRIELDTSRLNLTDKRLRRLRELSSSDAAITVGPKAANLGQLAQFFPDTVAPGFVIPFGIFHDHVFRVLDNSGRPFLDQIREGLAQAEQMRDSGADPSAIQTFIAPKLAHFRATIESMPLIPAFERELQEKLQETFGNDNTYGVFVRSDTNAEDLPGFTGAGLNLTVANQVGARHILQSIKNVWASPYTERAYLWRNRALKGTGKVYPSVIVMRTVPSEKSGVIATADLETGLDNYITVNVSEGVSAVVDGGVAESLLLEPAGNVRLLQQCRATYRKMVKPDGGFVNVPATGREYVLTTDEVGQLRRMVAEVKKRYPPARSESGTLLPWDIEFGFENGQLRLFQIRPLARFQEWKTLDALSRLEGPSDNLQTVRLEDKPL